MIAFTRPPAAQRHRPLAGTQLRLPTEVCLGWVDLVGWLYIEIGYGTGSWTPGPVTHPSANRARRTVTSLTETNALPLYNNPPCQWRLDVLSILQKRDLLTQVTTYKKLYTFKIYDCAQDALACLIKKLNYRRGSARCGWCHKVTQGHPLLCFDMACMTLYLLGLALNSNLKIEVKLLLSANMKSYMPRRSTTTDDLEWPCDIIRIARYLCGSWASCFALPKSDIKSLDFAVTRFLMKLLGHRTLTSQTTIL